MKKNQQVLLTKKLIFYQAMTEKEKKRSSRIYANNA